MKRTIFKLITYLVVNLSLLALFLTGCISSIASQTRENNGKSDTEATGIPTPASSLVVHAVSENVAPESAATSLPPFAPPFEPVQDFEIRTANYTPAEFEILFKHIRLALSNLPANASEFEKSAAINDYLYQYLLVEPNATGESGVDVLNKQYALCGGVVLAMAEMLYAIGIKSKYAYLYGGQGAHSMVEVFFSDGKRGLFDPTYGVFYYDLATHQPLSILAILDKPELARNVYYTKQPKRDKNEQAAPLKDVYSTYIQEDILSRIFSSSYKFDPYTIFSLAEGGGIANEGLGSFIEVKLQPGQTLGEKEWEPGGKWPLPWGELAAWQREDGSYLSWLYQLGQTLGYDIKHIYTLTNLEKGKTYTLRHYLARAYPAAGSTLSGPVITIQQVMPFGRARYKSLEYVDVPLANFTPYQQDLVFIATGEEMSFIYNVSGIIIITAIELSP